VTKRYRVTLTVEEREALGGMIARGKADVNRPGFPGGRFA
jgi:hypothetical protein